MHGLLLLLTLSTPTSTPTPRFDQVPETRRTINETSLYADIINRCPSGHNTGPILHYDRTTNAHESSHRLDAALSTETRNTYYVLNGHAISMRPPRLTNSHVAPRVPRSLRDYSYRLYVTGEAAQYGQPGAGRISDLLEEWSAYLNELETALEDKQHSRTGNNPVLRATVEMSIISATAAMAIYDHDQDYWQDEPQFRAFMAYQWNRMLRLVERGRSAFPSDSAEEYVRTLRSTPDALALRTWIDHNLR
jgi:hypothetical protein